MVLGLMILIHWRPRHFEWNTLMRGRTLSILNINCIEDFKRNIHMNLQKNAKILRTFSDGEKFQLKALKVEAPPQG